MVSIIIPLYNGQEFIAAALDSCLKQTYRDFEIIVFDDCSTDEGEKIVKDYIEKNDNIKFFKNESNLGNIRTVNKAIALAKGDYILVFDQDDLLPQYHIERMMRCFSKDTALVFCDYTIIDKNSLPIKTLIKKYNRDITTFDLSLNNCLHSCGLISRKSYLEKVGGYSFNSTWKNYGEWDLWIKMSQFGTLKYCKETKALYRRHESNMTNEFQNKNKFKIHREYCIHCMRLAKTTTVFNKKQKFIYYINFIKYYVKSYFHYVSIKEGKN